MQLRRIHPVICYIALTAYLLNLIAGSSGAVFCQIPLGDPSIEFACDHGHCASVIEADHDHNNSVTEAGDCSCASCPCEDTPLTSDFAWLPTRDGGLKAFVHSAIPTNLAKYPQSHALTEYRVLTNFNPLPIESSLQRLKTVVLIV